MKSIGKVIKEARVKKKISREKLEKLTKIKKDFIESLESEKWEALPEYPVVVGFVKNISGSLGLDGNHMTALLRRDYPPKVLRINPKPDIHDSFKWSPRLTFIIGIVAVALFIAGYLFFQYLNFIKPPKLEVIMPRDNEVVRSEILKVEGKTDSSATIVINNQPTIVSEDGTFVTEIEIFEGTGEVTVVARSRSGKETVIHRNIKPEIE